MQEVCQEALGVKAEGESEKGRDRKTEQGACRIIDSNLCLLLSVFLLLKHSATKYNHKLILLFIIGFAYLPDPNQTWLTN